VRAYLLIIVLPLVAALACCNQLPGGKPSTPQFTLAELFGWTEEKFTSTFGAAAVVVEGKHGRDYYWEAGEEQPTEVIAPDEFARRYPVSDFRLLPFSFIVSFQRKQVEMVCVARSYEPPASRIGLGGQNLRALKRDELLQELGPPDGTEQVGLRGEETAYSWQFNAGQKPLAALPRDYRLSITFDKFGRVTSIRVSF